MKQAQAEEEEAKAQEAKEQKAKVCLMPSEPFNHTLEKLHLWNVAFQSR
jgi:hypothetical protein